MHRFELEKCELCIARVLLRHAGNVPASPYVRRAVGTGGARGQRGRGPGCPPNFGIYVIPISNK